MRDPDPKSRIGAIRLIGILSVRPAALAETLRARAADEHVPTSALIRRILARTVREGTQPVLTVEQVEEIARSVIRESA